ncbi:MAG: hypothetical protein KDC98_23910, partial [Planctomycetes bacterium]|nr:hypothetical protein [Planctomycetota bacterium]
VAARLAEGRAVEAVRLWLEGITFLADCRDHFYLAHWSLGSQLVFGDEDLGAMSGLARELLAVGLSRLERQLMMPRTLDDMLAPVVANTLQGRDGDGRSAAIPAGLGACAGAWGHGFDPLARHLEGLDELRRLGESLQLSATDEATWLRRWQAFCAAGRCGESNIAKHVDHWFQTYERCRRNALAKVRLLRLALAFHQGRELPSLLDPHTAAPFVQRIGGDDAVFRGSDPDGGEWLAHRTGR